MNLASLKLSKQLHKLSGWGNTEFGYDLDVKAWISGYTNSHDDECPAYDLGYLLNKLPPYIEDFETYKWLRLVRNSYAKPHDGRNLWAAKYGRDYICEADTPEDAGALLAIELFKQKILTKGNDERKEL